MKKKSPAAADPRSVSSLTAKGPCVGWIAAGSRLGEIRVDYQGNLAGPLAAKSIVPFDEKSLAGAVSERREVVLFFEENDPRRPLLMGLVQSRSETPLLDALLGELPRGAAVEADVDRKRIVLEGKEEVVLRCGKSSITLRSNGKLIIRGAYVETHAEGTNRIKGGAVKIN